jgi:hypothetical protein
VATVALDVAVVVLHDPPVAAAAVAAASMTDRFLPDLSEELAASSDQPPPVPLINDYLEPLVSH